MRQFFRKTALILALAMVFLLGGCSGQKAPEPVPGKTLREHGEELVAEMAEIAKSEEYLNIYTGNQEVLDILTEAVEDGDYTAPKAVYAVKVPESAMKKILNMAEQEGLSGLSDNLRDRVWDRFFQAIPTQINSMGGADTLAAASICTASKTFVCAEATEKVIYLYVYKGGAPAAVTFLPGEGGAVSATGTFLLNEEFSEDSLEQYKSSLKELGIDISALEQ